MTIDQGSHDRHDDQTGDLSPDLRGATSFTPEGPAAHPERIAGYVIKNVIASGGMGTVFLAIQEHPRRTVALKMMKQGISSRTALRRFEFESLTLARLRHPNIAQVYEAGTFESGAGDVPYFAMEYIANARTITEFADAKKFGTRDRLKLFTKVCEAVQHGHQKGIIHRDLKPGNILVDSAGEPKIIDFGVARSTDSDMAATTLQTDVGQLVGTLQYMSPEQCEADPHDLDTRSDVYSLGITLYELLCGRLPYDVRQVPIYEAGLMIRQQAPAKPSSFNRALRGDVETITLKCLIKDRDHRYDSAAALALDIRRYLNNEPIEARSPSVTYQFRMFARRHRGAVAALATVGAVLVMATVISLVFAARANTAHKQAVAATGEAVRQRDLAVEAQGEARRAREESDRQRDTAVEAETRAQQQSYMLHVIAASDSLDNGSIAVTKRRLAQAPPKLRNWEWRYLENQVDGSISTWTGHESQVNCLAFGPAGNHVVTGTAGGIIRIWSAGRVRSILRGHDGPVYAVAFSPDGRHLASGGADGTIRLWDVAGGGSLLVVDGHDGVITGIAYSADGSTIASSSSDTTIRIWNASNGVEVRTLQGPNTSMDCLAFSPDGTRIASGSDDQMITLWSVATGEQLLTIEGHEGYVTSVAFSPDGSRLASASEDMTVRLWSASTGDAMGTLRGHEGYVASVAFSPDGTRLASTSEDMTVRLWDADSGEALVTLRGHEGFVGCAAFSPDGTRVATGSEDRTVRLWDAQARVELAAPPPGMRVTGLRGSRSVVLSPDDRLVAWAAWDGTIRLLDPMTGQELARLAGHDGNILSIAFDPTGSVLASAADDQTIRIWDARTGAHRLTLTGHERHVVCVEFSPDGERLASGSWDGTVRIWDPVSGHALAVLSARGGSVNAVAFSPDGSQVAAGATTGLIQAWDVTTGEETLSIRAHEAPIYAIAYGPGGTRLASASADESVKVWDASTGKKLMTARGHEDAVTSIAFSVDGTRLVSASADKTIKMWDTQTAEVLVTLRGHLREINSVVFGGDGQRLVSGSLDGTVRVWDAAPTRQRFDERAVARRAAETARPIIARLESQGLIPSERVQVLVADGGLSDAVRAAALNLVLRMSSDRDRAQ